MWDWYTFKKNNKKGKRCQATELSQIYWAQTELSDALSEWGCAGFLPVERGLAAPWPPLWHLKVQPHSSWTPPYFTELRAHQEHREINIKLHRSPPGSMNKTVTEGSTSTKQLQKPSRTLGTSLWEITIIKNWLSLILILIAPFAILL